MRTVALVVGIIAAGALILFVLGYCWWKMVEPTQREYWERKR